MKKWSILRFQSSVVLDALGLGPVPDWAGGLREAWRPGEAGARLQLERFLKGALAAYSSRRDLPAVAGTSRPSPHLRFGEVSPREVWHETNAIMEAARDAHIREAGEAFLRQLGWREFSAHLMVHYPGTSELPLRPGYEKLPWRNSARELKAWQRGRTGYPLVDAGMRELWVIGWMHNRIRMVTASFLTKHLMIHWLQGARWF